jgi:hypothetical protein
MRTKRRVAFILAAAGVFGVGLTAYPGSAAAFPPNCAPAPTSCTAFDAFPNVAGGLDHTLDFRMRLAGAPTWSQVTFRFDNHFAFNPGGIPTCALSAVQGKTIAQAWNTCGPGAPAANNAYLSPPSAVSGKASTKPPSNFGACTLVFNGPVVAGNRTVTLYARFTTVQNSVANCANPATNTSGNSTFLLRGVLTNTDVAPYKWRLRVPGINGLPVPIDDYYARLKRANYFTGTCPGGTSPWTVQGLFVYATGAGNGNFIQNKACS